MLGVATGADDVRSWGRTGNDRPMLETALLTTPPLTDMGESHEIDANDAYRVLMDRQRFRSRWNVCVARKHKLKGGATPLVRARPKAPAMRLDDRMAN